jgi:hypothetical protein
LLVNESAARASVQRAEQRTPDPEAQTRGAIRRTLAGSSYLSNRSAPHGPKRKFTPALISWTLRLALVV